MHLAKAAWNNVDATKIHNCWKKAGILPSSDGPGPLPSPTIPISSLILNAPLKDPVPSVENLVEKALDGLELRGMLQKNNRMDIEGLLNPVMESQVTGHQ
jgi:hypothetical protein